jgi:hypothetical protein
VPRRLTTGLLAAGSVLISSAPALAAGAPADVHVRVEGDATTLVPRTALHTTSTPVVKGGGSCSGTSAGGALDQATAGDWSGYDPQYGMFTVTVIKGESHTFSSPEYWGVYVNDALSANGVCETELQSGDDVLFAPDNAPQTGPPKAVLRLTGVPATVKPGQGFTVKVTGTVSTFDSNPPYAEHVATAPAAGATVSGGGVTVTTGSDGAADVTLSQGGAATLRATRGSDIRSASEPVCVTSGADGQCGSPPPCATDGRDGRCGTRDLEAPQASILDLHDGQVFAKGNGPRTLRGQVGHGAGDPSGVLMVKLRLTRNDHGRCSYFSGRSERFIGTRCGAKHGFWFRLGDRPDWSYLLPSRLARGRYVLDVNAIDKAGNRDDLRRRGGNRVVFTVR